MMKFAACNTAWCERRADGQIAQLLRERNAIDAEIAAITHRPMTSGHLGEWIATQNFDIHLERSADIDGISVLARCKVVPSTSSGISSARACWTPRGSSR